VDIGNNNIGSEGLRPVAEFIKRTKSLLWFSLYMNDISDEGAEKVAEALKDNKTISTIDLGGNNIHSKGVSAIAEILKDNTVLTTVSRLIIQTTFSCKVSSKTNSIYAL